MPAPTRRPPHDLSVAEFRRQADKMLHGAAGALDKVVKNEGASGDMYENKGSDKIYSVLRSTNVGVSASPIVILRRALWTAWTDAACPG
jgi:hypothetical protein